MRLGYACINVFDINTFGSCRLKRMEKEGVSLAKNYLMYNLYRTKSNLVWNQKHNIGLYRLTSDLLPFGSHEILKKYKWWEDQDILEIMEDIKNYSRECGMRITIHPGQFNNIGTPVEKTLISTIADIKYQYRILSMLGGTDMILHVGGVYGDKEHTLARFVRNLNNYVDPKIREVLRIENDDKSYNIAEVLELCDICGLKPMYDFHHDLCLPSIPHEETLKGLEKLWGTDRLKVHLSSGESFKQDRKHSRRISDETWFEFLEMFPWDSEVDVMIEAKGKNAAVLELYEKMKNNSR